MKTASFHLNLLRGNEVLSSSPVRLRVMLPIGALLACVGLLVWWGVLFTQIVITKAQARSIEADLAAKNSAHAEAIQKREQARELKLQLEQLEYYKSGVRAIGEPLAKFAELVSPIASNIAVAFLAISIVRILSVTTSGVSGLE